MRTGGAAENPHGLPEGDDEGDPHGHGQGGGMPGGMFQPPEDGTADAPSLPPGTLEIAILDANGKPMPGAQLTVGILQNSVSKGESRKRVSVTAGPDGVARLDHLETGSTMAYRPMVLTEGATFSMMPFRLPEKMGLRGVLHVYPVTTSITDAMVVGQSIIYTEVKDDRIQIQQAFKIYNFGKTAWVPKDLVVALPETFTAFTAQQGMTDITVEAVPKTGVRISGTFPPGQHMVEFRWQLPYSGDSEVRFDVGMTPNMAASRVIAPASRDMRLEVPGFPPPQASSDGQGQRALITDKQLTREEPPLKAVTIVISGLPTEGPGKLVATFLSAGGLVLGLVLGARKPQTRDRKAERARLLAELEELERAKLAGDVGPKTYERARRELVDQVARTFTDEGGELPAKKRRRRAA